MADQEKGTIGIGQNGDTDHDQVSLATGATRKEGQQNKTKLAPQSWTARLATGHRLDKSIALCPVEAKCEAEQEVPIYLNCGKCGTNAACNSRADIEASKDVLRHVHRVCQRSDTKDKQLLPCTALQEAYRKQSYESKVKGEDSDSELSEQGSDVSLSGSDNLRISKWKSDANDPDTAVTLQWLAESQKIRYFQTGGMFVTSQTPENSDT